MTTGVHDIIVECVRGRLTRAADSKLLDDIEAYGTAVVEIDSDDLVTRGEVTFVVHDHWSAGAASAEHWYRRAVGSSSEAIDGLLRACGRRLDVQGARKEASLGSWRRLVRIAEQLIVVDSQGSPSSRRANTST